MCRGEKPKIEGLGALMVKGLGHSNYGCNRMVSQGVRKGKLGAMDSLTLLQKSPGAQELVPGIFKGGCTNSKLIRACAAQAEGTEISCLSKTAGSLALGSSLKIKKVKKAET